MKKHFLNVSAIVIKDHPISEMSFEGLLYSFNNVGNECFNEIVRFDAITPMTVKQTFEKYDIKWNWPLEKHEMDEQTGIKKHPYKTRNHDVKKACALSHYSLWKQCADSNQPLLILEHDAIWVQKLDDDHLKELLDSPKQIIGINSPRHATRKWQKFADIVQSNKNNIQSVPRIDDPKIAQGLAGASAYLMKPEGARQVINKVNEVGLWHNDALLCYQLFDDILGVTKTWYTIRNFDVPSTTT